MNKPLVLCYGETLWDCLPDGLFAGGAPLNVAYHLHRHDVDARLVSAVGNDFLGKELRRRLCDAHMSIDWMTCIPDLPTGTVVACVDDTGNARYDITNHVAWDHISATKDVLDAAGRARGLVYGSLAQRSAFNRLMLERLLKSLPADALRVFDVNLRAPFDDLALVRHLASHATLLKVNAAEAARLVDGGGEQSGREESDARRLAATTNCSMVCVTAGERGAGLLNQGTWTWECGRKVHVADTVGAGDSFLAGLLAGLLRDRERNDARILAQACRLGEWVATRRGGTPVYDSSTPICARATDSLSMESATLVG